jgi:hypothetical protein
MALTLVNSYYTNLGHSVSGVSVTAGNLIVVGQGYNNSFLAMTCSDTVNTYNAVSGTGPNYTDCSVNACYAIASTTTSLTITTSSSNTDYNGIVVLVFSGNSTTLASVLDTSGWMSLEGSASTSHASTAITTTNANDVIVCIWSQGYWTLTTPFWSENSQGYTFDVAQDFIAASHKVVSATGSQHDACTTTAAAYVGCLAMAFTAAVATDTGTLAGSVPNITGAISGFSAVQGTTAAVIPGITGALTALIVPTGTSASFIPSMTGGIIAGEGASGTLAGTMPAISNGYMHGCYITGVPFIETWHGFTLNQQWSPDYSVWGQWLDGFASGGVIQVLNNGSGVPVLDMAPPAAGVGQSHACLVFTWTQAFPANMDMTFENVTTVSQLRTGGSPNPWEVAWVLFCYADATHFYSVVLKPNGWEIDKEDPAYAGSQRFLATGSSPTFPINTPYTIRVVMNGATITVYVNGVFLATVTDTFDGSTPGSLPPYNEGQIGLYCEDSHVQFGNVGNTVAGTIALSVPAITGAISGGSGESGTGASTIPAITGAIAGVQAMTGTSALAMPLITGAMAGFVTPVGALAGTVPSITGALAGTQTMTGTAAGAVPVITGTLAGGAGEGGTLAGSIPVITGTMAGITGLGGSLAGAVPPLTGAIAGHVIDNVCTLAGTIPTVTGTISGGAGEGGTSAAVLPAITGSIGGVQGMLGAGAGTIPAVTGAIAAGVGESGTLAGAIPAVTGSIGAVVGEAGTSAVPIPLITGSMAGVQGEQGTSGVVVPLITGTMTGYVIDFIGQVAAAAILIVGSIAGSVGEQGASASPVPPITGSIVGSVTVKGSSAAQVPVITGQTRGAITVFGSVMPASFVITGHATGVYGVRPIDPRYVVSLARNWIVTLPNRNYIVSLRSRSWIV